MAKYFSLVGLGLCPARRHLPLFLTFASSIWVHCRCISWLVIKQMTAPRCCRRRCATPNHTAHPLPLPPLFENSTHILTIWWYSWALKASFIACQSLGFWLHFALNVRLPPLLAFGRQAPFCCSSQTVHMYVCPTVFVFFPGVSSLLLMMRNLSLIFLGILFYVLFFASHHVPAETCLYHFRVLGSYTGKNKENP